MLPVTLLLIALGKSMTEVYKVMNTVDNVNAEPLFTTTTPNGKMRNTQTSMRYADNRKYFFTWLVVNYWNLLT